MKIQIRLLFEMFDQKCVVVRKKKRDKENCKKTKEDSIRIRKTPTRRIKIE